MDISEIRAKREALEQHLTTIVEAALREFQTETGVVVESVTVGILRAYALGEGRGVSALNGVRVQLERL